MSVISKDSFSIDLKNTITREKNFLARLSLKVRQHQMHIMIKKFSANDATSVLDVGFSGDETLIDTNFFEKFYPFRKNITAASVEDCSAIKNKYLDLKIVKIKQDNPLPFMDKEFDIVTSWATLEHVGNYNQQDFFISELCRVGKKVFLTTPYRGCIYEPHSGFFFLHWLPLKIFRKLCEKMGRSAWSKPANLNPLYISDLKSMKSTKKMKVNIYRIFNFLPSHIMVSIINNEINNR